MDLFKIGAGYSLRKGDRELAYFESISLDLAEKVKELVEDAYEIGYYDGNASGYKDGAESAFQEGYEEGYQEGVDDTEEAEEKKSA